MPDKMKVYAKFELPIFQGGTVARPKTIEFGMVTVRASDQSVYIEVSGDAVCLTLEEFKTLLANGDYLL